MVTMTTMCMVDDNGPHHLGVLFIYLISSQLFQGLSSCRLTVTGCHSYFPSFYFMFSKFKCISTNTSLGGVFFDVVKYTRKYK